MAVKNKKGRAGCLFRKLEALLSVVILVSGLCITVSAGTATVYERVSDVLSSRSMYIALVKLAVARETGDGMKQYNTVQEVYPDIVVAIGISENRKNEVYSKWDVPDEVYTSAKQSPEYYEEVYSRVVKNPVITEDLVRLTEAVDGGDPVIIFTCVQEIYPDFFMAIIKAEEEIRLPASVFGSGSIPVLLCCAAAAAAAVIIIVAVRKKHKAGAAKTAGETRGRESVRVRQDVLDEAIRYLEEHPTFEWSPTAPASGEVTAALGLLPSDYDYVENSQRIEENGTEPEQMTFDELRAAFTKIQRGERFCDGYIAGCISDGTVLRLLKRLKEISK